MRARAWRCSATRKSAYLSSVSSRIWRGSRRPSLPENRYYIFGRDGGRQLAEELQVPLLGQIPLVQSIREGGDLGTPIAMQTGHPAAAMFDEIAGKLIAEG